METLPVETLVNEFRIFYSWQSDLPPKTNRSAIQKALAHAIRKLKSEFPEVNFIADEATRGESGSPNIALTILAKIEKADAFIADISTIRPGGENARPCPNPNVIYELGYASAHVGWGRIILMFNRAHGALSDLPFDIRQQRVSSYPPAEGSAEDASDYLRSLLQKSIREIYLTKPKTPAEMRDIPIEKIRYDSDVRRIKHLLSWVETVALQHHIDNTPRRIDDVTFFMWDNFQEIVSSLSFSLHDEMLNSLVRKLYAAWGATMEHTRFHDATEGKNPGEGVVYLRRPEQGALVAEWQEFWNAREAAAHDMAIALRGLLEHLHSHFAVVNIDETNRHAWQQWKKHLNELLPAPSATDAAMQS